MYHSADVPLFRSALKSPQLLEMSGIGNPVHLKALGIEPIIGLPAVGENVQDHVYAGEYISRNMCVAEADSLIIAISYELKPQENLTTFDMLQDPEFAKEQARLQYV